MSLIKKISALTVIAGVAVTITGIGRSLYYRNQSVSLVSPQVAEYETLTKKLAFGNYYAAIQVKRTEEKAIKSLGTNTPPEFRYWAQLERDFDRIKELESTPEFKERLNSIEKAKLDEEKSVRMLILGMIPLFPGIGLLMISSSRNNNTYNLKPKK
ncbi:MAG: hypothetical protein AABX66_03160 [Nanoarchaeota archaeon]